MIELQEKQIKSNLPYVGALLILFLIGVILIGIVLFLRPNLDPLIVVGVVLAFVTTMSASIIAVMKAQETQEKVNSHLDEYKRDLLMFAQAREKAAHAEGQIVGQGEEQKRVATQLAEADRTALSAPVAPPPVKVEIIPQADPLPVTLEDTKEGKKK